MTGTIVHSALLTSTERAGWIRFADGVVHSTGDGDSWRQVAAADDAIVDATAVAGAGARVSPGYVDIHCHGGAGAAFEGDEDEIGRGVALHRSHGTTRSVLSLVSAPVDVLLGRVARIAGLVGTVPGVVGSHLEGPFLDPGHRGAHDPHALRAPDAAAVDALLEAGAGTIRQITLAPELPGAMTAIARFVEAGVVVAVGHTDADADAARAAFDAGARLVTHAFNAIPGIHHRAPGPIAVAAADPRITLEAIADGVHVDPLVLRMLFASAPGRVALITDAMAATGVGDGRYVLGSLEVVVTDGVARLAHGDSIAGSTLTMDEAVRTIVAAGVDVPEALRAATAVPARALGLDPADLAVGSAADALLLDADLRPRAIWQGGHSVTPA